MAFSDGFIGGVVGGALFRLISARFSWAGWGYSWTDVVILALVLGSFEAWRVTQGRTLARAGGHLVGLLVAVLVLWWAIHRWALPSDGAPKRQPPSRRAVAAPDLEYGGPRPLIPLTDLFDDELVRLARQGDDAAFVELMRRTRGASQRRANRILRNHAAAEDEVQNAYLSAWRHIADFEGDARFSTWISRIVVNQCLMRLRSLRKCQIVALDDPGPDPVRRPLQLACCGASVEEQVGGRRRLASLRHHILMLPPLLRGVLVLRDINEISSAEVARQLGISVAAVKSRLLRARLELQRRMQPHSTGKTSTGIFI